MRIDDFLSTVGIVKRRTVAKKLAAGGMVEINGRAIKPAYAVKVGDMLVIKGSRGLSGEILSLPTGSVSKDDRPRYFHYDSAQMPEDPPEGNSSNTAEFET